MLLSVSLAVIALLIAVVVYLVFQNRSRTKHPPSNQGTVFSNIAYKDDPENRQTLGEAEANQSNNIDLGTGSTQTQEREDPEAIYEEASRPLPPIPPRRLYITRLGKKKKPTLELQKIGLT